MYFKVDPFIVRETWTQENTQSSVAEFTFTALDEETASKIAKALTHAVKLSGGKEEPF